MKSNHLLKLGLIGMILFGLAYEFTKHKFSNSEKSVSLPEEISQVEEGDTLYVTKVSDSIYIGFRK